MQISNLDFLRKCLNASVGTLRFGVFLIIFMTVVFWVVKSDPSLGFIASSVFVLGLCSFQAALKISDVCRLRLLIPLGWRSIELSVISGVWGGSWIVPAVFLRALRYGWEDASAEALIFIGLWGLGCFIFSIVNLVYRRAFG